MECNRPCSENHKEFCGGQYSQSYYDTNVKLPPPRNLIMINRTENTILIQWRRPGRENTINRYIVWTKLTKKFGSKILLPHQWTIESMDSTVQYELINLNPASVYNISVRSHSNDFGEGALSWIEASTEIGN